MSKKVTATREDRLQTLIDEAHDGGDYDALALAVELMKNELDVHLRRGQISPDELIPLVNDTGACLADALEDHSPERPEAVFIMGVAKILDNVPA